MKNLHLKHVCINQILYTFKVLDYVTVSVWSYKKYRFFCERYCLFTGINKTRRLTVSCKIRSHVVFENCIIFVFINIS